MSGRDAQERIADGLADLADAMQGIRSSMDKEFAREATDRRQVTDKEYEEAWSDLIEAVASRGVISRILLNELRKELEDRDKSKTVVYPYHLQTIAKRLYADW